MKTPPLQGVQSMERHPQMHLHPFCYIQAHGRTILMTICGEISNATKNSFPFFLLSSCSTSSIRVFPLRKHLSSRCLWTKGAKGRFSRYAASTVPTWRTGGRRPASNLTFNSSTTLPICLGYISRCNSTTRFPYSTSQVLEILPP